ncbi:MAG: lipopolysaccharide biosynthesis protein [Burkholderiales bacterium]|nr:lipopolysaccharide biosynthesis protein [Burkholderiales bacterium]MDE2396800.1 lipopolysaccharide biosynthesis protein [Burkholderiales bacterium]
MNQARSSGEPASDAEDPDLYDGGPALLEVVTPLASHWRSLIGMTLLAGTLGMGASYLEAPVFTANATFLPPQQSGGASAALASLGALAAVAGISGGPKSSADQYIGLMESVTVSDRIIDRFKLMQAYDVDKRFLAREKLAKNVHIAAGKKDGLVSVSVDDTDPNRAAAMANQYIAELQRLTSVIAVTEAQQRRVFFGKQLEETKSRLTAAQQALQDSGFSVGALKAEPRAAADSFARLRAEQTATEVQLETMRRSLADSSAEVQQLLGRLQALRSQLRQIEQTTTAPTGDSDYVGKYREFKYQETLFDLFARQYELARVDESREGALIQVVDPAQPPEHKSRPKRAFIAIATAALAGFLYATFLVIRGRFRVSLQDPEAAERWAAFRAAFRRS